MKVSYELKQGYTDIWNEESEEWDRYIKVNKKSVVEEPKGIPEKLDHLIGYDIQQFDDLKEYVEIATNDLFGKVNKIIDTLNQVLDYLKSKGE